MLSDVTIRVVLSDVTIRVVLSDVLFGNVLSDVELDQRPGPIIATIELSYFAVFIGRVQ